MATSRSRPGRRSKDERSLLAGMVGEIGDVVADLGVRDWTETAGAAVPESVPAAATAPVAEPGPAMEPIRMPPPASQAPQQPRVAPARPRRRPRPRPVPIAPARPAAPAAGASGDQPWSPTAASAVAAAPAAILTSVIELAGRRWSPATAMQPLPPLAPPLPVLPRIRTADADADSSWLMTGVVLLAVLVAAAVVIATHIDLGKTTGPPFSVAGLDVHAAGIGGAPPVVGHYSSSTQELDYTCAYNGSKAGDSLVFHITSQPSAPGSQTVAFPDATRTFTGTDQPSGEVRGIITPPGHAFVPGRYTLEAIHDGVVLRSSTFVVDEPVAPTPAPTDSASPSPSASPGP